MVSDEYSKLLLDKSDDFLSGDLKLSVWIPAECVGWVIGRNGVVIENIKRETRTDVDIMKPVGSSSLWTAVVIKGDAKRVRTAYEAVCNIVADEIDEVVAEFHFHRGKHSCFLGFRGFEAIKKVSAETNVRIFFPSNKDTYPKSTYATMTTLEGECDNVYRALELLSVAQKELIISKRKYLEEKNQQQRQTQETSDKDDSDDQKEDDVDEEQEVAAEAAIVPEFTNKVIKRNSSSSEKWARGVALQKPATVPSNVSANDVCASTATATSVTTTDKKQPLSKQSSHGKRTEGAITAESYEDPEPSSSDAVDPAERKKKARLEHLLTIPNSLVGLLLARRPSRGGGGRDRGGHRSRWDQSTAMNQLQKLTRTIISRVAVPGQSSIASKDLCKAASIVGLEISPAAESSSASMPLGESIVGAQQEQERSDRRRGRRRDADDSDDEEDDNEEDDGSDDDSEGFEDTHEGEEAATPAAVDDATELSFVDAVVGDDEVGPTTESKVNLVTSEVVDSENRLQGQQAGDDVKVEDDQLDATAPNFNKDPVLFRITSFSQESVDMAVSALEKIIVGERISIVIADLKSIVSALYKHKPKPEGEGEQGVDDDVNPSEGLPFKTARPFKPGRGGGGRGSDDYPRRGGGSRAYVARGGRAGRGRGAGRGGRGPADRAASSPHETGKQDHAT